MRPLFANVCDAAQERRLVARIESEAHLWTPMGLTAVDQSVPYYRADGYWNGTVWFPYQWFIWKGLLDLGYGDLAFRIARTALDIWKDEVTATYNCFEHFVVASRGRLASLWRAIHPGLGMVQRLSLSRNADLWV
ncbi:MAG: hypothetical protein KIT87_29415 [Anaerolineae bacterium]|nr:hypothetical protein [Anaerolineae bacterium]